MTPKLMITPGEPAGIGPDITIMLAQHAWPAELVAVCDPKLLIARASQLKLRLSLIPFDLHDKPSAHSPGTLKIIPVSLQAPCQAGQLNVMNASYVLTCLETATDYCLQKKADALVTGPIHKGILNDAAIAFSGHTEFLANRCGVDQVIMLFVTPKAKVALATTHLALSNVPSAIQIESLTRLIRLLHSELQTQFKIANPTIVVCGLNPHAGENGYLGREEVDIIEPCLERLRHEQIQVIGPLAADTVFTPNRLKSADAVLAMYHDQALPVVKYMSFGHSVNVTLGLPLIRTSVDHGVALDVAGTRKADAASLSAALRLALELCNR